MTNTSEQTQPEPPLESAEQAQSAPVETTSAAVDPAGEPEAAPAVEEETGARIASEAGTDALAAGKRHLLHGAYDQAQDQFEQALAVMEQIADRAGLAEVHEQLAITYLLRAEYDCAAEAYAAARKHRRQLQDQAGEADILRQLALLQQLVDRMSG